MLKKIYKSLKTHWKIKKIPLCWAFRLCGVRVPKSLQWIIGAFSGSGSGTSGDPYQITDWGELQEMNDYLDNTTVYFKLMNDLDSTTSDYDTYASSTANSGAGWTPIGVGTTNRFSGELDGNGKIISDLYINRAENYQGLFSSLGDSVTVKNLGIKDADITLVHSGGLLCGDMGTYNGSGGDIENCFFTGTISGEINIGGVIAVGEDYVNITNCYSNVNVQGNTSLNGIGGIVGRLRGDNVLLNNVYAAGSVNNLGSGSEGGIVGDFIAGSPSIDNSFWDTDEGPNSSAGGTGKTTIEMKDRDTFTDTATTGLDTAWDMAAVDTYDNTKTWGIGDLGGTTINSGYPYLMGFQEELSANTTNFFQFF